VRARLAVANVDQRTVLVDVLERMQQRRLPSKEQGNGECDAR